MNKQPAGKKPNRNIRSSARSVVPGKGDLPRNAGLRLEPPIDYELGHRSAAQAVDLCAEQRGFLRGAEFQNWLEAEAEIDRILMR